jgi:branched-chain amino acid transport system permease protein
VAAGFLSSAVVGLLLQVVIFRHMQGQDLRQTLVTIGISIVLADLMLWIWGAEIYTFDPPDWIYGSTSLPLVEKFPTYRIAVLLGAIAIGFGLWWFLARTKVGMMIRAGVDDRGMLAASASTCSWCSRSPSPSAPAWRAWPAWSAAARSRSLPVEDTRYLLGLAGGRESSAAWAASAARLSARFDRPGRTVRPGVRADLQRGVHLRRSWCWLSRSGRADSWGKPA